MIGFVRSLSDRLLNVLLPESTAGACVPEHGQSYWTGCYCYDDHYYHKYCTITCYGGSSCGSCQRTQNIC